MPRQNLERLQDMCKAAGKVVPSEWPEGLVGVGPDMRSWVKSQDEAKAAPKPAPKPKANPKPKAPSKDEE
jgi:hypothetical protein